VYSKDGTSTAADFLAPLKKRGISISMDGRGRALDNVFIERLWRSLKYELIYPGDFADGRQLFARLVNSGPLSHRIAPGTPRASITLFSTRVTCLLEIPVPTSMPVILWCNCLSG
jgi:transposase InsO family protein